MPDEIQIRLAVRVQTWRRRSAKREVRRTDAGARNMVAGTICPSPYGPDFIEVCAWQSPDGPPGPPLFRDVVGR
jgi:hypothetical protein